MKYDISGYQILKETSDAKKKKEYWSTAIGLNQVDQLEPSEYLISLAEKHIEGDLDSHELEQQLSAYYGEKKKHGLCSEEKRQQECDIVSKRIVDLLEQGGFSFSPQMLKNIHRYLFTGIDDSKYHPGEFRQHNIYKNEPILHGNTVNYANYFMIEDTFRYDFAEEKKHRYHFPFNDKDIQHLAEFISSIWQVHPFYEGNTRTTAVFVELYLRNMGLSVNNEMFEKYAEYFRGALVRSNYADLPKGIVPTFEYINYFLENLLCGGSYNLNKQELTI